MAIKKARERRGMTQAELARALGVTQTTIGRLEAGGRADPRFSTVASIADALQVSLDTLARDAGISIERPTREQAAETIGKAVHAARLARKTLAEADAVLESVEALGAKRRVRR